MARKKSPKTASPSDTTQAFNEETHSVENVPSNESELPDQPEESTPAETPAPVPNEEPIEAEAVGQSEDPDLPAQTEPEPELEPAAPEAPAPGHAPLPAHARTDELGYVYTPTAVIAASFESVRDDDPMLWMLFASEVGQVYRKCGSYVTAAQVVTQGLRTGLQIDMTEHSLYAAWIERQAAKDQA